MGNPKDSIDGIKEVIAFSTPIFTWASKKMWSRILLMAAVGFIGMGGVTLYNFFQVKEFSENTDSYLAEMDYVQQHNRDQRTLDYINLCINALKAKEANSGYYCQTAVKFYKDNFLEIPGGDVAEVIKRKAYGAMKVDMEVRMRAGKTEAQLDQKRPKLDEISAFLFTPQGLILFCSGGIVIMLLTILTLHRINRKNWLEAA